MSTLAEIEEAIESLPASQVEELAAWLEKRRLGRPGKPLVEEWLGRARGVAREGVTTAEIMALTRDEE